MRVWNRRGSEPRDGYENSRKAGISKISNNKNLQLNSSYLVGRYIAF